MSKTTRKYQAAEILSGAVIFVSIGLLVMITLLVGDFGSYFSKRQYFTVLFRDAKGLKESAPVTMLGLDKGQVDTVESGSYLDPSTGEERPVVRVTGEVIYDRPLPSDTRISIDKSITGRSVIKVVLGSAEPQPEGKEFMGVEAKAIEDITKDAGVVIERVDRAVTTLTDTRIIRAIRNTALRMDTITEKLSKVSASLERLIPANEEGLQGAIANLMNTTQTIKALTTDRQERLEEALSSVEQSARNVENTTDRTNRILSRHQPNIEETLSNIASTSRNFKTTSREIRWQPWVLLNEPDEIEIRDRSIYNSALELSEGAEALHMTVKEIKAISQASKREPAQEKKIKDLLGEAATTVQKFQTLQDKLWKQLESHEDPKEDR